MADLHPLIIDSLRRTRRAFLLVTFLALPMSIFMIAAPAWSSESHGTIVASVVIGAIFLVTGGYMAWMTARYWVPERSPLGQLLVQRPGDIVWIYVQEIRSHSGPIVARSYGIRICTAQKTLTMGVKARNKDAALGLLAEIAPQATFGYSRDLAKQFKRDPESLRASAA